MTLKIKLDPDSDVMLKQQLCEELREAVLSRRIEPGMRLPPSRELAEMLKISRSTVTEVYEQLLTEGYLESRGRNGTFVSPEIPGGLAEKTARGKTARAPEARRSQQIQLSSFGEQLMSCPMTGRDADEHDICFYPWRTAFDHFPVEQWSRVLVRCARRIDKEALDYATDPLGLASLRQAIAGYLARARGINCHPDQVIVLSGFQQAIDLIARIHLRERDRAVVENPCYVWTRYTLGAAGATLLTVPVDDDGIVIDRLPDASVRLVCVSPSHQYPTGTFLPLPRRLALLNWASKRNALIVEDEHDSEFRYDGKIIPALKSLDEQGRVIYAGTFAKVLFPGLAAGYLVLPENLVDVYARARILTGEQIPYLLQDTLAEFIQSSLLERHIGRMTDLYRERRVALIEALEASFGERAFVSGTEAGMHLLVQFDTKMNSQEISAAASSKGVGIISTATCYTGKPKPREFVLGYGDLCEKQLREGVKRLAAAMRK